MTFGLTVTLDWWQWLLMVLGAGFCWAAGTSCGEAFVRTVGSYGPKERQ